MESAMFRIVHIAFAVALAAGTALMAVMPSQPALARGGGSESEANPALSFELAPYGHHAGMNRNRERYTFACHYSHAHPDRCVLRR
jgi:hypothetical protein